MRSRTFIGSTCSSFFAHVLVTSLIISMVNALDKNLRIIGNKRSLQSQCKKDCDFEEIVHVLIETTNEIGKNNTLDCSMPMPVTNSQEEEEDFVEMNMGNANILGIDICPGDKTILENSEGVLYVEYDQDMKAQQDSNCKMDCSLNEIERVLVLTISETGKENALTCSMTSSLGDIEIKMNDGYILGMGICPGDRSTLQNLTGIELVEDDHEVSIQIQSENP